ncbi:MAG: UDP-N-acetylmuramoyl-tripeptide--D-alanyl-D-alanine ligase [Candidatus Omnitrophica bacterium]|nr:UDP-N-acetylmuramoyl-tripeptide--D-alanyl-D-alanine ligase [Candidatus Omnitrophota bacterium]
MFTINELLIATGGVLVAPSRGRLVHGISIDSRTTRAGEAFIAIPGDRFDGHAFINTAIKKGAACIIAQGPKARELSRGACVIAVEDTVKALGDIARFHRSKFDIPVIAITGSTGKTTTKDMLAWVLAARFKVLATEGTKNNRIGLPMTLLGLRRGLDAAIVERGTNHFGEIEQLARIAQPTAAIITNIGPSHLEYFKTMRGVAHEKYSLIKYLRAPRLLLLNADDAFLRRKIRSNAADPCIVSFGCLHASDVRAEDLRLAASRLLFTVGAGHRISLGTVGAHNAYNALAAIACGRIFGMSWRDISRRLENFRFPPGRLVVRSVGSSRFIDDTYNANPASLRQALYALEDYPACGKKIVVLGDMLELGSLTARFHAEAGRQISRVCDTFIAVGRFSAGALAAARASGLAADRLFLCPDARAAQQLLFTKVRPCAEDVVLVKGSRAMHLETIFEKAAPR